MAALIISYLCKEQTNITMGEAKNPGISLCVDILGIHSSQFNSSQLNWFQLNSMIQTPEKQNLQKKKVKEFLSDAHGVYIGKEVGKLKGSNFDMGNTKFVDTAKEVADYLIECYYQDIKTMNENYSHGILGIKCVPPSYLSPFPGIVKQPSDTTMEYKNWIGHKNYKVVEALCAQILYSLHCDCDYVSTQFYYTTRVFASKSRFGRNAIFDLDKLVHSADGKQTISQFMKIGSKQKSITVYYFHVHLSFILE